MLTSTTFHNQGAAFIPERHAVTEATLETQKDSPLHILPYDVILHIFSFLGPRDIIAASFTCRALHTTIQDDYIWKELFSRIFPNTNRPHSEGSCFDAIKNHLLLSSNLTQGVYTAKPCKMSSHALDYGFVLVKGKLIFPCPRDEIAIVDFLEDFSADDVQFLLGHKGRVSAFAIHNERLYSASRDHTIKIWDLEKQECINTFKGHEDQEVCEMIIAEGKLIAAGEDGMIMVWNCETGKYLATLVGNPMLSVSTRNIYGNRSTYLSSHDGKLFCKNRHDQIKIWNLETGECLKTFHHDHFEGGARLSTIVDGKLICGSNDTNIRLWDLNTGECVKTVDGFETYHQPLAVEQGKLLTHCPAGTIRIRDLETGKCIKYLTEHHCWNRWVKFIDGKIISCSIDSKIVVWDFNASDKAVFEEIMHLFKSEEPKDIQMAMERFCRMPKKAKAKVYEELYLILYPYAKEPKSAEDAFHDRCFTSTFDYWPFNKCYEINATATQKGKAIKNYLLKNTASSEMK